MAAIQQTLEQLYDTAIDNLTELQGGWEADIYAFEVNGQALVIRLMQGNDADIKVQREFEGMRMLNKHLVIMVVCGGAGINYDGLLKLR